MLEYALEKESKKLVHVEEVPNGANCGCVCPSCDDALIAKNRCKVKQNHFAHQTKPETESCQMSLLHLLAQHAFLTIKEIELPKVSFVYNQELLTAPSKKVKVLAAQLEYRVGDYFADVWLETEIGDVFVEIYVSHAVEPKKSAYYQSQKHISIEYDLSCATYRDNIHEVIQQLHNNKISGEWIYPWCKAQLIQEYQERVERELQQYKLKRKEALKKELDKFLKTRKIMIPEYAIKVECRLNSKKYEGKYIAVPKHVLEMDEVDITHEDDECVIVLATKLYGNTPQPLNVCFIYPDYVPHIVINQKESTIMKRFYEGATQWTWEKNNRHKQHENKGLSVFKQQCIERQKKKDETRRVIALAHRQSKSFVREQGQFSVKGYHQWCRLLRQEGLYFGKGKSNNPVYPFFIRNVRVHDYLWVFDEWYLVVFTELARLVDRFPVNVGINYEEIFDQMASVLKIKNTFYQLLYTEESHDFFGGGVANAKIMIVNRILQNFEREMVIEGKGHSRFCRKCSLLKFIESHIVLAEPKIVSPLDA